MRELANARRMSGTALTGVVEKLFVWRLRLDSTNSGGLLYRSDADYVLSGRHRCPPSVRYTALVMLHVCDCCWTNRPIHEIWLMPT